METTTKTTCRARKSGKEYLAFQFKLATEACLNRVVDALHIDCDAVEISMDECGRVRGFYWDDVLIPIGSWIIETEGKSAFALTEDEFHANFEERGSGIEPKRRPAWAEGMTDAELESFLRALLVTRRIERKLFGDETEST